MHRTSWFINSVVSYIYCFAYKLKKNEKPIDSSHTGPATQKHGKKNKSYLKTFQLTPMHTDEDLKFAVEQISDWQGWWSNAGSKNLSHNPIAENDY